MTQEQVKKRYDSAIQRIFNFRIFVDAAIKKAPYPSELYNELCKLKDEAGYITLDLQEEAAKVFEPHEI